MINNLKQLNELRKAMGSLKDLNIDDNLDPTSMLQSLGIDIEKPGDY